jgi:hypothetical protein
VRRHEILRTTFQLVDNVPVQVIAQPEPLTIEVIDLSHLPEDERIVRAQRMVNERIATVIQSESWTTVSHATGAARG